MRAAHLGQVRCVRVLIDAGADKDAKNNVRVSRALFRSHLLIACWLCFLVGAFFLCCHCDSYPFSCLTCADALCVR